MPVNQNDSMSATAIIGYHVYISNDLNTLRACYLTAYLKSILYVQLQTWSSKIYRY